MWLKDKKLLEEKGRLPDLWHRSGGRGGETAVDKRHLCYLHAALGCCGLEIAWWRELVGTHLLGSSPRDGGGRCWSQSSELVLCFWVRQ